MANKILELSKLSINFGGLQAVQDFSFEIMDGELHGLIGPNGAGKTTIFNMIIGAYLPTSGTIRFLGEDITKNPSYRRVRKGMSIKMQIPGVFGELTVRENMKIALGHSAHRHRIEAQIDRLLEQVKLEALGNPIVKNLSHGQQQWLEIAMALATSPKLLLLDEPAAGLGTEETAFTINLIKELNHSGLSIIFIDHNIDFVKELAQRITVLHYGRKFAEGTVSDIVNHQGVKDIYLGTV